MNKKTRFRLFGFEYLDRHLQIGIGLGVLFVLNFVFYIVSSICCFLFYNNGTYMTASAFTQYFVKLLSGFLPFEIITVSLISIIGIIICIIFGINKKRKSQ